MNLPVESKLPTAALLAVSSWAHSGSACHLGWWELAAGEWEGSLPSCPCHLGWWELAAGEWGGSLPSCPCHTFPEDGPDKGLPGRGMGGGGNWGACMLPSTNATWQLLWSVACVGNGESYTTSHNISQASKCCNLKGTPKS